MTTEGEDAHVKVGEQEFGGRVWGAELSVREAE